MNDMWTCQPFANTDSRGAAGATDAAAEAGAAGTALGVRAGAGEEIGVGSGVGGGVGLGPLARALPPCSATMVDTIAATFRR